MAKSIVVNGKTWTVDSVRELIKTNDTAAIRAMILINTRQTIYEQQAGVTIEKNHIGFAHCHAFLSKFVERYNQFGSDSLTPKMMFWIRRAMPKYAKQVFQIMCEKGGVN